MPRRKSQLMRQTTERGSACRTSSADTATSARVPFAQAVVEPLVVGVVEALLLQRPFHVPIDFRHEAEVRNLLAHAADRLGPERLGRDAPGPLEDFRQDQHRHVAAHAVALTGDSHQFADHGFLRSWVAVVELQRVRPAGEIRIAAVGQQQFACARASPTCSSCGARARSSSVPANVILGVFLDPASDPGPVWFGTKSSISRRPRWRSRSRRRASAASPPKSRCTV